MAVYLAFPRIGIRYILMSFCLHKNTLVYSKIKLINNLVNINKIIY